VDKLEREVAAAKASETELRQELNVTHHELHAARDELRQLREELRLRTTAQSARLEEELRAVQSRCDEAVRGRVAAEEVAFKAKSRAESLRSTMEQLLASDDSLAEENEELQRRITELQASFDRVSGELRQAQASAALVDELQVENERLSTRERRLASERAELARCVERLQKDTRTFSVCTE